MELSECDGCKFPFVWDYWVRMYRPTHLLNKAPQRSSKKGIMDGEQRRGDAITNPLTSLILFCYWTFASVLPMKMYLPVLLGVILVAYSQGISITANHSSPLTRSGMSLSIYLLLPADRLNLIRADAVRSLSCVTYAMEAKTQSTHY